MVRLRASSHCSSPLLASAPNNCSGLAPLRSISANCHFWPMLTVQSERAAKLRRASSSLPSCIRSTTPSRSSCSITCARRGSGLPSSSALSSLARASAARSLARVQWPASAWVVAVAAAGGNAVSAVHHCLAQGGSFLEAAHFLQPHDMFGGGGRQHPVANGAGAFLGGAHGAVGPGEVLRGQHRQEGIGHRLQMAEAGGAGAFRIAQSQAGKALETVEGQPHAALEIGIAAHPRRLGFGAGEADIGQRFLILLGLDLVRSPRQNQLHQAQLVLFQRGGVFDQLCAGIHPCLAEQAF